MKCLIAIQFMFLLTNVFAQIDTAWVMRYDGPVSGADKACAIAVDKNGNAYVTGTSCVDEITTVKYSSEGNQIWVRRFDQPPLSIGGNHAVAVALDNMNNIYVAGHCQSLHSEDFVLIKYNNYGDTLWIKVYGTPWDGIDELADMDIDSMQNVYVMGLSSGPPAGYHYLVVKYDSEGNECFAVRYSGEEENTDYIPADMAVDKNGNVYVTGYNKWPLNSDYVTVKFSPAGTLEWVRRYDGPANSWDEAAMSHSN